MFDYKTGIGTLSKLAKFKIVGLPQAANYVCSDGCTLLTNNLVNWTDFINCSLTNVSIRNRRYI